MISKYSNHKLYDFKRGNKVKLCWANNPDNLGRIGTVIRIDDENEQVVILIGLKHNNFRLSEAWFESNRLVIVINDENIICKKLK